MKFLTTPALIVAVAAASVASQSLSDLPACAQQAGLAAIQQSGCAITDVACVCSKAPVLDALRAAIAQGCSANDQTSAVAFANTLCGAAGQSSSTSPSTASMTGMSSMAASSMPESMMSSMSSASVAYTAYSGTSTSTTSMMNTTMTPSASSASLNMSMSSTSMDMISMSGTASPSQFTGGSPSRASSLEREWILPALGIAGVVVLAF